MEVFEHLHHKRPRENRSSASHSDYEASSRSQNSEHLSDRNNRSGKMQKGEQREHDIEGFVMERQASRRKGPRPPPSHQAIRKGQPVMRPGLFRIPHPESFPAALTEPARA